MTTDDSRCICGQKAVGPSINGIPVCAGCRTLTGAMLANAKRFRDKKKKVYRRPWYAKHPSRKPKPPEAE